MTEVKICGLNDAVAVTAAVAAGADLLGFVFVPASPRGVTPAQAASIAPAAGGPLRVGLFVDPTDAQVAEVLAAMPLDLLQLHGAETPARCAALHQAFGVPIMKAVGIAGAADLDRLAEYAPVVDRLLLDAPAPAVGGLPGGNARGFDWALLAGRTLPRPWLLAGGLTPETVGAAIAITGAPGVDVSSGVERARGVKDPACIAAFLAAVRGSAGGS